MAQQRRGGFKRRKKVDYIAANKIEYVDYKDTELLSRFISERGKILPRRVTGTSAKNQRKVNNSYQTCSRYGSFTIRKRRLKNGPVDHFFLRPRNWKGATARVDHFFMNSKLRKRIKPLNGLFQPEPRS